MEIKRTPTIADRLLEKFKCYFSSRKDVLLSAFIVGLLTHMYALTNKLVTVDDVAALYSKGATITSGRWFLALTSVIFPNYSMPWIFGIISLLLLCVCACLLVDFFDIKGHVSRILVGSLIASFPTITGFICYMFTSAPYCLGMLLCVAGMSFIARVDRRHIITGVLLLVASIGIYQTYFVFASAMFIVLLIKKLLVDKEDIKPLLFEGIKYFLALLVSILIYYIILKLACQIFDVRTENGDYALVDTPFWRRLLTTYTAMFGIFFKGYFNYVRTWPSVIVHGFCILIVIISCIKGMKEIKSRSWLLLVLLLLWPISVNMLYLIASPGVIHVMSQFAFLSFYFLVISLSDRYLKFRDITTLCLSIVIILNIYAANETYLEIDLNYRNAYSFYTSLFADISQTEGYRDDMNIVFIGTPSEGIYQSEAPSEEISGLVMPVTKFYSTNDFIRYYLGRDVSVTTVDSGAPDGISTYPSSGSIWADGNTIYVIFS